jgi:putative hemolysin
MSDDITVKEAYEYYMSHTRSRIPVYKKNPDKIHSILTIRDLLKVMAEGKEDEKLNKIVIPNALKIPLNQPIDKLLEIFQKSHRHIAIVLDEYG